MTRRIVSSTFSKFARLFSENSSGGRELNATIGFSVCLTLNFLTATMLVFAPFGLTNSLDRLGPTKVAVLAVSTYVLISIALFRSRKVMLGDVDLTKVISYREGVGIALYVFTSILAAAGAAAFVASFRS